MASWFDRLGALRRSRLGFHIDEEMSGTHQFEPGMGPDGTRPMRFRVRWGPADLASWLDVKDERFMSQPLAGTISIDGLCDAAPCDGTLALRYAQGKIRYEFAFRASDKDYLFVGEKVNIRPWNLPVSHTTCFGTVTEKDTGKLVSRSITHFRMGTAPAFAASFRLTFSPSA